MARPTPYAELHAHTNFSFLDGASPPDELVARAVELGLTGLAATDHDGLYGAVRFTGAAEEAGLHPVIGVEIGLGDAAVADPDAVVVARATSATSTVAGSRSSGHRRATKGRCSPRSMTAGRLGHDRTVPGCPAIATRSRRTCVASAVRARGPRLVLLARDQVGWRSLTRLLSRANLAGTKAVPRVRHALLEADHDRVIALSGGRDGEIGRRLLVGDRAGARAAAERLAGIFGSDGLRHRADATICCPDDDWLVAESVALARDLRLPVVVTNAVHYARREDRELHDVLTAIRHGRTLDTLADLRRPDGESYLKSGDELAALGASMERDVARAWREGIERSVVDRGGLRGRPRVRAVPLPGLPGARRGDAVLVPLGAVLGRRPEPLPPADLGGRQAAGPRARRHRAGRPRRVLPHLLGPDALRQGAGDPGPGPGQRDQLDRVVHPRDQPGRADRPQPPVRAVHQPGPDDVSGRRHRLQLGAARGGHPVHLPALRAGAHGDGLQPRHVPGAVGGPRGGLRAGVPAAARRPGRQGARDVRLA